MAAPAMMSSPVQARPRQVETTTCVCRSESTGAPLKAWRAQWAAAAAVTWTNRQPGTPAPGGATHQGIVLIIVPPK
jgi:hypothetical protein